MKSKLFSTVLAVCLILSLLCGCSVDVEHPTDTNTESTGAESENQEVETTDKEEGKTSATEEAYNTAINLTKSSLKKSNRYKDGKTTVSWSYEGLYFVDEDCDWINNDVLNSKGTVNQGAIYRAMAFILDDYDTDLYSDYSKYSEILIGSTPDTMADFLVYANNANKFICNKNSLISVMKALQQSDSVEGTLDYDKNQLGVYNFTISSLSDCAEDLKVSEEMLGYILAFLEEYAPDITFDGNSCHIEYTSFAKKEPEPLSKSDFSAEIPVGGEKQNIYDNMIRDGYTSYYCYYDASNDPSKNGVIVTNRDIHLGDSKETVISKYGETNSNIFIMQNNVLYQDLLEYSPAEAGIMRSQCSTFLSYAYEKSGAIEFYFDENDLLSWIVFYAY